MAERTGSLVLSVLWSYVKIVINLCLIYTGCTTHRSSPAYCLIFAVKTASSRWFQSYKRICWRRGSKRGPNEWPGRSQSNDIEYEDPGEVQPAAGDVVWWAITRLPFLPIPAAKTSATFQCHICLKLFARAYNLRSHLHTNTGELQFACHVCDKAFVRQQDYKRYEFVHKTEA
jgi:hypothetical protein